MIQQIMLDGFAVDYVIGTGNIVKVLGTVYIYKVPTFDDILKIVYLGLTRTDGYTLDEFVAAFRRGKIYTSRKKGQYSMSQIRWRIMSRVRQINRTREVGT